MMAMRRMVGVAGTLAMAAALAATQPGCGGGATTGPNPEVKAVMAPDYQGGTIAEEGPGAGTAGKKRSGGPGSISEEGRGAGTVQGR